MPDTSHMCADEQPAMLQSEQEAIGHLQACLQGLAIAERNAIPDLNVAAVEQFLGCERVASWMRQSGEELYDYLRSCDTAPVRPSAREDGARMAPHKVVRALVYPNFASLQWMACTHPGSRRTSSAARTAETYPRMVDLACPRLTRGAMNSQRVSS